MRLNRTELKEDIKYREQELEYLKGILYCNRHQFYEFEGDDLSTTGPTGLYRSCKKCGFKQTVGYVGSKGKVYFKKT